MSVIEKPRWFGGKKLLALALVSLASAPPLSTYIATRSFERIKARPVERTIRVTGSAKQRITSDLIEWSATVSAEAPDKLAAYRRLHTDVDATVAYLRAQGVPEGEIFPDSATIEERFTTVYEGTGDDRIAKQVLTGYQNAKSLRPAGLLGTADVNDRQRVTLQLGAAF